MQNGRVTLVAKDATVRQILTEWARVGQTKIVNVERIPGGPMTLELTNVPEAQALDVLLRSVSGYIAAPRPVDGRQPSRFDRIIVMPTLASARPATVAPPPPAFQQTRSSPPPQAADDDDDDSRRRTCAVPPVPPRGPVFNTFPQPQVANPQAAPTAADRRVPQQPPAQPGPPASSPTPVAPYGGVSVPGMVAPPPRAHRASPAQPRPALRADRTVDNRCLSSTTSARASPTRCGSKTPCA